MNLVCGVGEPGEDFVADHRGVGDDCAGILGIEDAALEFEDLGVLAIEAACEALPEWLEGIPSIQPSRVDSIAGPVDFAAGDSFQAQVDVATGGFF